MNDFSPLRPARSPLMFFVLAGCLALLTQSPRSAAAQAQVSAPVAVPIESSSGLLDPAPRSLPYNPAAAGWLAGPHASVGFTRRPAPDTHAFWLRGALGTGNGLGGFYGIEAHQDDATFTRFHLGFSLGAPQAAFGLARQWGVGHADRAPKDHGWTLSSSQRLSPWLGTAVRWHLPNQQLTTREVMGTVALRLPTGKAGVELAGGAGGERYQLPRVALHGMLGLNAISHLYGSLRWTDLPEGTTDRSVMVGVRWGSGVLRVGGEIFDAHDAQGGSAWVDVSARRRTPTTRPAPIVLERSLAGAIGESPRRPLIGARESAFTDLLAELDDLARAPDVQVFLLHLESPGLGLSRAMELARVLERVQSAGVDIWVYLEDASLTNLLVASSATHVLASPATTLNAGGISRTGTYFAGTLERYGIEAQFVRIAGYKTAPEPLLLRAPSEEESKQTDIVLDQFWGTIVSTLASARRISEDDLEAFFLQAPATAPALVDIGLVDELHPLSALRTVLRRHYNTEHIAVVSERPNARWGGDRWLNDREIAVLHIEGTIVSGRSFRDPFNGAIFTGSDTVAEAVEAILDRPSIRAVIVRIDSPGGSAYASDQIQQTLLRLVARRPVVVSMGNVAASGGYYAAALGVPIYVDEATITGSIGIFAGRISLDTLLQRQEVEVHRSARGGPSGLFDFPGLAWTPDEEGALLRQMRGLYVLFLERVAEARDMDIDAVDLLAEGRIWTGRDAVLVGLADHTGGFLAALDSVRPHLRLQAHEPIRLVHAGAPGGLLGAAAPIELIRQSVASVLPQPERTSPLPGWWTVLSPFLPSDLRTLLALTWLESGRHALAWQPLDTVVLR